jgi:hypothetical protein
VADDYDFIDQEAPRKLNYDPRTGIFTHRTSWGPIRAGDEAGSLYNGYIYLRINNKTYLAHRIAWLMYYGCFPENTIDHKDRIRHHNWISNLREATYQCQNRNRGVHSNNSSGVTGVCWRRTRQKWQSQITVDRSQIHLGLFSSLTDAVIARWQAEKKCDFPNCNTTSSAFQWLKKNDPFFRIELLLQGKR